ncbi:hypothetical protein HO133_001398 [Letharia lupina]|uniref:Ankyrin n=1 Tax=Letharia lupina TaxID=560253 RepID=A0A8H6CF08_9LECA|nr:uncharacterized protein HO133_001398 [Letharia lupina]KAF6222312.1 hypothetical protein HO133_001398 [Letharia lupina]
MKDINFAMTGPLETASTAIESPTPSPWASPTDAAQVSTFDGEVDGNDYSELDRSPTLAKQDHEPEIRRMLAQEQVHTFMNEEGQTALHLAAKQDAYLTLDVLSRGVDINIRNVNGETPLMCAVNAENIDTVTLLLKNHADVNAVDDQHATCLHFAAMKDESGSMTQLLLRRNPDIEIMDGMGLTPLFLAAFKGNDAVVRQLLEFGAEPEAKESDGFSALHYACMQANHVFMSRLLDKRGPDFEAFYEFLMYGLPANSSHSTISKRRAQIVHSLLAHNADVHASSKGLTPLHISAATAQEQLVNILLSNSASSTGVPVITAYWGLTPETVDLLLTRGANVSTTDCRWNKTALTWTAEIGSPATLKVLLSHGASVHHQDTQGSSALHYAAANARNDSIALLLDAGANPNLLDSGGNTPLIMLASGRRFYLAGRWWNPLAAERKEAATLLLSAGCDASVKNMHGNLAVHYAAGNGYRGVLEAIEKAGGDLELLDGSGRTAVEWAKEKGEMEVVSVLKRKRMVRGAGGGAGEAGVQ